MDIRRINDKNLRIRLTPFDMVHYELTCETIDYVNTETRRALWDIFDEAKHKTGFDAASGRISVKVYPEKNGGCEIYITKLGETLSPPESDMTSTEAGFTRTDVRSVYVFPALDALLSACRCLYYSGWSSESSAYSEFSEGKPRYYLSVEEPGPRQSGKLSYRVKSISVGEFGRLLTFPDPAAYLYEHCDIICEKKAVEILAKLC